MPAIRVLIAEDQLLMRQGLQTILESEADIQVVGAAANGQEAVLAAQERQPDVVLMDVQMPAMNGIEATAALAARCPSARVLILTTFDTHAYVVDGVKAGARGYLCKDVPASELIDAIRRIARGEQIIQADVAARLISQFSGRADTLPGYQLLSEREQHVLRLLAAGCSNKEIGRNLMIAEGTVKNHVSAVLTKLQATNRTHATFLARRHGIV